MKILYVTGNYPQNPQYGGALREHGILRGLSRQHEIQYLYTPSYSRRQYHRALRDMEQRFKPDVVWYFWKYAVRAAGFPHTTPSIVDFDNVPWRNTLLMSKYVHWERKPGTLLKAILSYAEDNWIARQATVIVNSNRQEQKFLPANRSAMTVSNGFDFSEQGALLPIMRAAQIVFFGLLSYYPNLEGINWFCHSIWPRIADDASNAKLEIIGSYDRKPIMPDRAANINLRGFVENLDEAIRTSAMLIVPLRIGSGTRIKILEAWANGLPVVTTSLGCEGLNVEHGKTALIADSAEEFAKACIALLSKPELGAELAANALHHGQKHFDWQMIYPTLDDVLARAIASR